MADVALTPLAAPTYGPDTFTQLEALASEAYANDQALAAALSAESGSGVCYGVCSTPADTSAKVVTVSGFILTTGVIVIVDFATTNTAASPTLNVSGTGAKPVWYNNAAVSAGHLMANRAIQMVFNGTQWEIIGWIDTTYSAMSVAEGTTGTATASRVVRADYLAQIIDARIASSNPGLAQTTSACTYASGYSSYSASYKALEVVKTGLLCVLNGGIISCPSSFSAGTYYTYATLPSGFAPESAHRAGTLGLYTSTTGIVICQARVNTSGALEFATPIGEGLTGVSYLIAPSGLAWRAAA